MPASRVEPVEKSTPDKKKRRSSPRKAKKDNKEPEKVPAAKKGRQAKKKLQEASPGEKRAALAEVHCHVVHVKAVADLQDIQALAKAQQEKADANLERYRATNRLRQRRWRAKRSEEEKAMSRKTTAVAMKALNAKRKELDQVKKIPRPRRCKPTIDTLNPFVINYKCRNMGVLLTIENSEAFFDAIEWYRNWVSQETQEAAAAKFEDNCKYIKGKAQCPNNTVVNSLKKLRPKDYQDAQFVLEVEVGIQTMHQLLNAILEAGLPSPRQGWEKHCRDEIQIFFTALLSGSTA